MKTTTTIINKSWKIKDLEMAASTEKVKQAISEYNLDPNCRAFDWISDSDFTDLEKASFIFILVK